MASEILSKIEQFCKEEMVNFSLLYEDEDWWCASISGIWSEKVEYYDYSIPVPTIARNTPDAAVNDVMQEYRRLCAEIDQRIEQKEK